MSEPYGTVRWFGPSWGAPVNDPPNEIPGPVGEDCIECNRQIGPHVPGIRLPYASGTAEAKFVFYHRDCFLRELGIPT